MQLPRGVLQLRDVGSFAKILPGTGKAKINVPQTTFNTEVEEARPGAQQELSELEFSRPRHVIEITKPLRFETKNHFQELADDEEGNERQQHLPVGVALGDAAGG